ncbi:MAG: glycine/betaine ABC transporter substrate-binding protein, partial [Actinobacteria bacterium]
MSDRFRVRRGRPIVAAVLALVVVAGLAAAGTATATTSKSCGTVTLNEQAWAGSTANTYVAKAVLQKIGCKVKITQITEIPVYQAMANGKTDAVLEDWQHVDQYKQYITKQHTVVMGGPNGVTGHIGWYIPTYLMQQYPQFKTWKGLKGKESIFKSPESGSQGMFLGGDPSYVQKDQQLIKALGLNFKFVSVGAEPAQVARWSQLYKQ